MRNGLLASVAASLVLVGTSAAQTTHWFSGDRSRSTANVSDQSSDSTWSQNLAATGDQHILVPTRLTTGAMGNRADVPPPGVPPEKIGMPADKGAATAPTTPGIQDACKCLTGHECGERVWISADYLMWWIRHDRINVPLVLNENPNPGGIGPGVGDPTVSVSFGPSSINDGMFSGGQMKFGYWIDPDRGLGIEIAGFVMEQKAPTLFSQTSAPGGPGLALSFLSPAGVESGYNVNFLPGQLATIRVESESRFYNGELNLHRQILGTENVTASLIVGFRYFGLRENLSILTSDTDPAATTVFPGNLGTTTDAFSTKNDFYAGQIGVSGRYRFGQFSVCVSEKAALGTVNESLDTNGEINFGAAGRGGTITVGGRTIPIGGGFVGSFYALPSNIGRQTENRFAFLSDSGLTFEYEINGYWSLTAGYNFIYLTSAVRPGNQIDRVVNTANSPLVTFLPSPNTAPLRPAPLFNQSDFAAQGISLGVTFRY